MGSATFDAGSGGYVRVRNAGSGGFVLADAVRFVYAGPEPASPVLSVSPASLDFGTLMVGNNSNLSFVVQNLGRGTLVGSASVATGGTFRVVSGSSYSLDIGQSATITIRCMPAAPGVAADRVVFTGGAGAERSVSAQATTIEVVVDNSDGPARVVLVGTWSASRFASPFWGTNYFQDGNSGKGTKSATFHPDLPLAGLYDVYIWYPSEPAGFNWSSNTLVDLAGAGEPVTAVVNQKTGGGAWRLLGRSGFDSGTNGYVRVRNYGSSGFVCADAIRFVYAGPVDVIVDNADAPAAVQMVGAWTQSQLAASFWHTNYVQDGNSGKGAKSVTFRPDLPLAGVYEVCIWYPSQPDGFSWSSNTLVELAGAGPAVALTLNQKDGGGSWVPLGTAVYDVGTNGFVRVRNDGTSGFVCADAVRFTLVGPVDLVVDNADGPSRVQTEGTWTASRFAAGYWPTNYLHDGNAGKGTRRVTFRPNLPLAGFYDVFAWYPAEPSGLNWSSSTPVELAGAGSTVTVALNQKVGGGRWAPLGSAVFDAGTNGYVRVGNAGTSGFVTADAIRFFRSGPALAGQSPVVRVTGVSLTDSEPRSGLGMPEDAAEIEEWTSVVTGAYEMTECHVTGINNPYVIGTMYWTNASGGEGIFPASANWSFVVTGLAVGSNVVTVVGTNQANSLSSASFVVVRAEGVDADGDGMPDWWEQENLGGVTTMSAEEDPDGDGAGNWSEWRAGTNPRDAASVLQVRNLQYRFGALQLEWPAVGGRTYAVRKASSAGGEYRTVAVGLTPFAGILLWEDPASLDEPAAFYRVVVE
jgi:hypothetical protein